MSTIDGVLRRSKSCFKILAPCNLCSLPWRDLLNGGIEGVMIREVNWEATCPDFLAKSKPYKI